MARLDSGRYGWTIHRTNGFQHRRLEYTYAIRFGSGSASLPRKSGTFLDRIVFCSGCPEKSDEPDTEGTSVGGRDELGEYIALHLVVLAVPLSAAPACPSTDFCGTLGDETRSKGYGLQGFTP